MLTSIFNLTSGQQQESPEISTSLFHSQQSNSFDASQNLTGSNSDFSEQLNQFRQLLQGPIEQMGKSLPEFKLDSQIRERALDNEKLSQLQLVINKFEQLIANQSLEMPSLAGKLTESSSTENNDLQHFIGSISDNLNQLVTLASAGEHSLTDQQESKLSEAIDVLEFKLNKLNLTLAEIDKLPDDSAHLKIIVTELLSDYTKAMQRVNQALLHSNSQNNTLHTALPLTNLEQKAGTSNSEDLLILKATEQSTKNQVAKESTASLNYLVKGERGQTAIAEDSELLAAAKTKILSNNAQAKADTSFLLPESKSPVEPENLLLSEKANKLANSLSKSSEGLLAITKNMSIAASPIDVKTIQSLSSVATNVLEPSTSIVAVANEAISGLNPQSTQVASQSNIQQGLNLRNDFSPNLALRIQWIFQQALSSAEIMMDPPELGPLSVKMQHRGGETNIIFQVNNQQTKEMIEENLSKLKELLEEQGIALGDTQVKQNQQQSEQHKSESSQVAEDDKLLENDEILAENNVSDSERVAILDAYI